MTTKTKEKRIKCVRCPNCGGIYHQATSKHTTKQLARPDMLRLLPVFANLGWDEPPPDASAGYGVLECAKCGQSLAPSGYLTIAKLTDSEVQDVIKQQL